MTINWYKHLLFDYFGHIDIDSSLYLFPPSLPKNGVTSLIIASYYGQTSVVQALLQGGATINTTTQVRHNCFMESSKG